MGSSGYNFIDSSALILDIRNFTPLFKKYQKLKSSIFLDFIQQVLDSGVNFCELLSAEQSYHLNPTGDGFLIIFTGERCAERIYLLGILLYFNMNRMTMDFGRDYGDEIGYGIGIEMGPVQKISCTAGRNEITTYLGDVINISSRLEAETKAHSRVRMILGPELVYHLHESVLNFDCRNISENLDKSIGQNHEEWTGTRIRLQKELEKLLLTYRFDHNLKGVAHPVSLYALSNLLCSPENSNLRMLVKKLSENEEQFDKAMKIIGSGKPEK